MPYPTDSVVSCFENVGFRVELGSTSTGVVPRVVETQTGREVSTEQLDAGLRLRIQDEQAKAEELVASANQSKPQKMPDSEVHALDQLLTGLPFSVLPPLQQHFEPDPERDYDR